MRSSIAAWVSLLVWLGSPTDVLAEPGATAEPIAEGTVAVVGDATNAVTMRLAAELRFAGFDVEVVEPRDSASAEGLVALTKTRGVDASVQVEEDTVWISDREGAESVQLSVSNEADRERAVAVVTVELVRARLEPEPEPPPAVVEPPPPEPEPEPPPPEPRPRFFLALEAAFGGSPGGVPAAAHVRARARYAPHRNLGVVLSGTAPVHAVTVRGAEGTTTLRTGWLGVGPWLGLRGKDHPVVLPSVSATVGPAFIGMRGQASSPFDARDVHLVDAMLEAVVALDVAVWRSLRVRTSVGAGACAREIRVRFAERTAATWCRPEAFGTLGLGVVLP